MKPLILDLIESCATAAAAAAAISTVTLWKSILLDKPCISSEKMICQHIRSSDSGLIKMQASQTHQKKKPLHAHLAIKIGCYFIKSLFIWQKFIQFDWQCMQCSNRVWNLAHSFSKLASLVTHLLDICDFFSWNKQFFRFDSLQVRAPKWRRDFEP